MTTGLIAIGVFLLPVVAGLMYQSIYMDGMIAGAEFMEKCQRAALKRQQTNQFDDIMKHLGIKN